MEPDQETSLLRGTVPVQYERGVITEMERYNQVLDACEAFLKHRFLALPVVDDSGRLVGVVDLD